MSLHRALRIRIMRCSPICLWIVFSIMLFSATCSSSVMAADLPKAMEFNKTGEKLVESGDYRRAIEVFHKMRESCGDHEYCRGVAAFWLGRCHLEVSEYDQAMPYLDSSEDLFTRLNKPVEQAKVLHVKGRVYAEKTNYEQSFVYYDLAEKLLAQTRPTDERELFWLLANRARVNIYLNRYGHAAKDLDAAERLVKGKADPKQSGLLSEHRGLILAEQQHYDQAMKLYGEALKRYQSIDNLRGVSAVLNKMGLIHESMSRYSDALKCYEDALRIAEQLSDAPGQAFVLNNMGMVHRKRGNYETALEVYAKALKIRTAIGKDRFYYETLNNLALAEYLAVADKGRAFDHFNECYQASRKAGLRYTEASALHNMAWVEKDRGNLNSSRALSETAIVLAEEIGHRRFVAQATLRLGNLYEYYGNFDEALKYYKNAADIQRKVEDKLFLSHTLVDMANISTRRGEFKAAKKYYEEALEKKTTIGVPLAETLCKFALFYIEKERYRPPGVEQGVDRDGDLQAAESCVGQAEGKIGPSDKEDLMLLTYARGRLSLERNLTKEAEKQFGALQTMADAENRLKYKFLSCTGLGLAFEKLGAWSESERAYGQAVQYAEDIRKRLSPQEKLTFLEGEQVLGGKHIIPYEGLARVRMLKGDKVQSLEAAEFAKARSFSDKVAQRVGGSAFGVDEKLLTKLENIEHQIGAISRQREECQADGGDRTALPELEAHNHRLQVRLDELERRIEKEYPSFHRIRFPRPLPLDESAMKDDEWTVSYKVTDSSLLVYLTQGRRLVDGWMEPVNRDQLADLVKRLRRPLEVSPGLQWDEFLKQMKGFDVKTARTLYDLLLRKAMDRVEPGQAVIIIPDDALAELPFEILVTNDGGELVESEIQRVDDNGKVIKETRVITKNIQFLTDRNPLAYYHSITALTVARQRAKYRKPGEKLLVIANPVVPHLDQPHGNGERIDETKKRELEQEVAETIAASNPHRADEQEKPKLSIQTYNKLLSSFGPLPLTEKLAADLKNRLKERADIFTERSATMEIFEKTITPKISTYGNIVFATHGYFGQDFPEIREPVLLMSLIPARADNLLRMSSVMGLRMNADVVVLLACQTGLGKHVSGEGTLGMGRAFQYAGASAVLMSLWSVEEEASVRLVKLFLENLDQGKSKNEALRQARQRIRQEGFNHPFFWAPFVLSGEM